MQEQTEKMLELSKSKNTIEYELRSETDRLETERISLEKDLNSVVVVVFVGRGIILTWCTKKCWCSGYMLSHSVIR